MRYSLTTLSLIFLLLNGSNYRNVPKNDQLANRTINPLIQIDFKNIRDTIYTLKDHIIEINLTTHKGIVKFRNGNTKVFLISGGTKSISEGIETREGLFALHWKSKKLYSSQFDSTEMLYWMSFNSGIGMHALSTHGYYRHLGKRNVSHGCVRVSREDAKEIFDILERGTPVLVNNGKSAVTVAFDNTGEDYKYYSFNELRKLLPKRYNAIYNRRYFIDNKEKIIIDENNVNASGLPIGNVDNIPTEQIVFSTLVRLDNEIAKVDNLDTILAGNSEKNVELSFQSFIDSLYAQK
ncbi:L,D-transpeptidase [Bacteroidota bacterium]